MKDEKQIKEVLSLYIIKEPSPKAIQHVKACVRGIPVARNVPPFSPYRLLKSQIRTLKPSFWLICLLYVAVIIVICMFTDSFNAVIVLCAATPFLTIAAMPILFINKNPVSLELESSCLYHPKTILAGKMVLCGITDLIAVVIGSAACAFLRSVEINVCLILSLVSFTTSAWIAFSVCYLFKNQTGIWLSAVLFAAFAGILISSDRLKYFINALDWQQLAWALLISALLLISFGFATFEKYQFEGSWAKDGN